MLVSNRRLRAGFLRDVHNGEAEIVELANIPAISRDPSDDKFLATAAVAEADYLVTEDKDILVLKEHGRTAIVSAAEFLAALESA